MSNVILYGASGHGKVILEILELSGHTVSFILDDNTNIKSLDKFEVKTPSQQIFTSNQNFIISIGDNLIRKKIVNQYNLSYIKAIHPLAVISKYCQIGLGTVVMARATINPFSEIGKHCIINTGAIIEHDCKIDDFVHISPSATLCGGVTVQEGTHIGAGAVIIPNIKVGKWSVIGAGSVIIKDIPDYCVAVGNPARIVKILNP